MTLRDALTRATAQLDRNPDVRAEALRDAAMLLRHTLQISQATLLAHPEQTISLDQQAVYQALIYRRLNNEPVQYITGEQEFYGLNLQVTSAVLIPRPETEILVEAVLMELDAAASLQILDVGTGSGAIAIALAHHLRQAHITAVDLSSNALAVASVNAAHHHLADRIRFVESDLLNALVEEQAFDAIVSNPPYIPTGDRATLHSQVRDYEPESALFAGEDGLEIYRRLIPQAYSALKHNGLLALEIGQGQREDVSKLLAAWAEVRFVNDLQQIPRVVLARKPLR